MSGTGSGPAATASAPARHGGPGTGRTLIFVVSEDWYFLSHRLPMARAARDLGLRVVVATRVQHGAERIRGEGFEVVPIPMDRGSLSPLKELAAVIALARLFRRERPALVHNVAIKPILHGGLAAAFVPKAQVVNAFTGLGAILGEHADATPLRRIILRLLRRQARRRRTTTIVQNQDDRQFLLARGLAVADRMALIRGSGVDIEAFVPGAEPEGPPVALHVSRLLHDKGVAELVEAARLLRDRGSRLRIRIAGDRDPANPNSIRQDRLEAWRAEGLVEFLGRRNDIPALWRQAHIAVLPSYREGMPKGLLEAAACGRPLVTTDVPGCRDLVPDGRTGLLVPPRDPQALAEALAYLERHPEIRRQKGQAARRLIEEEFSEFKVMCQTANLYRQILATMDRRV